MSTISSLLNPSAVWTANTVEKIRIPHMRLTILLRNGVILPSLTAPCSRRMNVAYVRKVPNPAPTIIAVKFNNYSGIKM